MKIFTRIILGICTLGLVLGSKASSLGVVPGGLPLGTRTVDASKSDTVFSGWRAPSNITVVDLGVLPVLNIPSYNPNADRYSPLSYLIKGSGPVASNSTGKKGASSFANGRTLVIRQGAKEAKLTPSLNAYPNPSRGITKISFSSLGVDNYKIRISNAIGKVYKEIPITQPSTTEPITVDLSPLPAGIYFYSLLVNEKMVETKRLILQQQ